MKYLISRFSVQPSTKRLEPCDRVLVCGGGRKARDAFKDALYVDEHKRYVGRCVAAFSGV